MGSGRHKLSAAKVAKASTPGYLIDGGGLYLQIARRRSANADEIHRSPLASVTKSWAFRYRDRATGKLRELGLGGYPDVSLEAARAKASEYRGLLREGRDPKAEKALLRARTKSDALSGMTFDQAAAACIASKRAGWRNLKRMGRLDITVHGFRSTFRDWAGEQTSFPREVIEHALAHQLKDKAEAA